MTTNTINVYEYTRHHLSHCEPRQPTLVPRDAEIVNHHYDAITGDSGPIVTSHEATELTGVLTLPDGMSWSIAESRDGEQMLYIGDRRVGYSAAQVVSGAVACDISGAVYQAV